MPTGCLMGLYCPRCAMASVARSTARRIFLRPSCMASPTLRATGISSIAPITRSMARLWERPWKAGTAVGASTNRHGACLPNVKTTIPAAQTPSKFSTIKVITSVLAFNPSSMPGTIRQAWLHRPILMTPTRVMTGFSQSGPIMGAMATILMMWHLRSMPTGILARRFARFTRNMSGITLHTRNLTAVAGRTTMRRAWDLRCFLPRRILPIQRIALSPASPVVFLTGRQAAMIETG